MFERYDLEKELRRDRLVPKSNVDVAGRVVGFAAFVSILIWLAMVIGAVYVVVHFIYKYW